MPKKVLFLCSGNYYRSRFAEHLFNHLAIKRHLEWRAESRALSTEIGPWKTGPISVYAAEGLTQRNITVETPHREPLYCENADLEGADIIIALKEAEHRKMLKAKFPTWEDKVHYWHVHDIDKAHPKDALKELDDLVCKLVAKLASD